MAGKSKLKAKLTVFKPLWERIQCSRIDGEKNNMYRSSKIFTLFSLYIFPRFAVYILVMQLLK